jgi:glutamine synthetase adenylyltransferase
LAQSKDTFIRIKIEKNDKAPFKGILMTSAFLARLVTEYEKRIETLQIQLKSKDEINKNLERSAEKITEARVEAQKAKTDALNRDLMRQKKIYERALNKATLTPPWYKSRYLSFIAGALVSGAVCVGTSITISGKMKGD